MGAALKNPPIYLTAIQVRFNPVLKLVDYLPAIQESFRRARFSDFAKHTATAIKIDVRGAQVTPTPETQERYTFGDVERTHSFILDTNSLSLRSSNHGQFESFSTKFLEGLNRVHDVVQLEFTERVGLRYLDRIVPLDHDDLNNYLAPEAFGLGGKLGGEKAHSYCETVTAIRKVKLVSRAFTRSGPLLLPPDLMPLGLEIAERFKADQGPHTILDNDGFFEGRETYSVSTVNNHLVEIHGITDDGFHAIATPYAFEKWDE